MLLTLDALVMKRSVGEARNIVQTQLHRLVNPALLDIVVMLPLFYLTIMVASGMFIGMNQKDESLRPAGLVMDEFSA